MSDKERQTILERTSFKNVSGNWQFGGDMTPERFLRIAEDVTSERQRAWNEALDAAIERIPKEWNHYATLSDIINTLEQLKTQS